MADFSKVIEPVICSFDFGDFWPTGVSTCCLDAVHHGFGAGINEANLFKIRRPGHELLSVFHFNFSTDRERGAQSHLRLDTCKNFRMSMTMNERGHIIGKISPLHAFDIGDVATLALRCINRVRLAQNGVAATPARHNAFGALIEGRTLFKLRHVRQAPTSRLNVAACFPHHPTWLHRAVVLSDR